MTEFTDIHICESVRCCEKRATAYALFRGSLTLVCPEHAFDVQTIYDADLYDANGEEYYL